MNIGLLVSGGARLGNYWKTFLKELGVQLVLPTLSDEECLKIGQESLPTESATVQLALGRILAMGRVEAVIIPSFDAVSVDPWNSDFSQLLTRRISGLPQLIEVPDFYPEPDDEQSIEAKAAELGISLTHNAGMVRRALDKAKPFLTAPRQEPLRLNEAGKTSVALIGPRSFLHEPVLSAHLYKILSEEDCYPIPWVALREEEVLARSKRTEAKEAPLGEQSLFGALSLLAGKSTVRGSLLLAAARDGATAAVLERLSRSTRKPTFILQELDTNTEASLRQWLRELHSPQSNSPVAQEP